MMQAEPMLFDALPLFPRAMPNDELTLLRVLEGCDWPDLLELTQEQEPAARRLEAKGLIKISRRKTDPVAHWPTWFAGKLPASAIRATLPETRNGE